MINEEGLLKQQALMENKSNLPITITHYYIFTKVLLPTSLLVLLLITVTI